MSMVFLIGVWCLRLLIVGVLSVNLVYRRIACYYLDEFLRYARLAGWSKRETAMLFNKCLVNDYVGRELE